MQAFVNMHERSSELVGRYIRIKLKAITYFLHTFEIQKLDKANYISATRNVHAQYTTNIVLPCPVISGVTIVSFPEGNSLTSSPFERANCRQLRQALHYHWSELLKLLRHNTDKADTALSSLPSFGACTDFRGSLIGRHRKTDFPGAVFFNSTPHHIYVSHALLLSLVFVDVTD